jgi:hypothetical protein
VGVNCNLLAILMLWLLLLLLKVLWLWLRVLLRPLLLVSCEKDPPIVVCCKLLRGFAATAAAAPFVKVSEVVFEAST